MDILIIASAVAVVSWTIAKEEIFSEIRNNYCKPCIENENAPYLVRKCAYMPTCEYCCSFWVTLLSVFIFHQQTLFTDWRGYLLGHLVTWAVAVAYMSIYQLVRVDIRVEQKIAK